MRARTGAIILGMWLAASVGEAGWLGGQDKPPAPVDVVTGKKVQEGHKQGNRQRHTKKYQNPSWGNAAWKQIIRYRTHPAGHFNKL